MFLAGPTIKKKVLDEASGQRMRVWRKKKWRSERTFTSPHLSQQPSRGTAQKYFSYPSHRFLLIDYFFSYIQQYFSLLIAPGDSVRCLITTHNVEKTQPGERSKESKKRQTKIRAYTFVAPTQSATGSWWQYSCGILNSSCLSPLDLETFYSHENNSRK